MTLDDWLRAYHSRQMDALSSAQKNELQKLMKDTMKGLEQDNVEIKVAELDMYCQLVDQCSMLAKATIGENQTLMLDEFMAYLLEFSVWMCALDRNVHKTLKENTSFLSILTSFLNEKYREEDENKILSTIEHFSRDLTLTWTEPYLPMLIKVTFAVLSSASSSSKSFAYSLRILNNIILQNSGCLTVIAKDEKYKDVVKRFCELLTDEKFPKELTAMIMHFFLVTDRAMKFKLDIMNCIKETFLNLHMEIDKQNTSFRAFNKMAGTIHHMGVCVKGWFEHMLKINTEQHHRLAFVKTVKSTMAIIFEVFFAKCVPHCNTAKGLLIVEHLLSLLMTLCPRNMPDSICEELWDSIIKAINELSYVTSGKSKVQISVLEAHLYFVDRLIKSESQTILPESFTTALKIYRIVESTDATDTMRNVLTIRLMSRLTALAELQKKKDVSVFLKMISEESLIKLLNLLLAQNFDDAGYPPVQMSSCVVEVLNVICKYSKNPTAALKNLEKQATYIHVANCFNNGDEDLIAQTLLLVGAVGFSAKCRAGVAKILTTMKDLPALPMSITPSPVKQPCPSYSARVAMSKLNHNLEIFGQSDGHKEDTNPAVADILTWYKLKVDMQEMELFNLNNHIFQLNRANSHLKTLLNKQSEFTTKHALTTVSMQKNVGDLKTQLDLTNEKKDQLELKHAKAMNALRTQLNYHENLFKSKAETLATVEKELKSLKEHCSKLEESRKEDLKSFEKVSGEKRKLQEKFDGIEKEFKLQSKKLSTMELDYKKSEEARITAESLLEAEKRKTEIIQQVLGNRLN